MKDWDSRFRLSEKKPALPTEMLAVAGCVLFVLSLPWALLMMPGGTGSDDNLFTFGGTSPAWIVAFIPLIVSLAILVEVVARQAAADD